MGAALNIELRYVEQKPKFVYTVQYSGFTFGPRDMPKARPGGELMMVVDGHF